MLRAVRGRGGRPLPGRLRHALERSWQADLGAVRVHGCSAARALCGGLGALACAVDGAIMVGGRVGPAILAHEAAHVLQGRRPGAPAAREALEAEADRAAAAALGGCRASVCLAAGRAGPLAWEETGHYYTVYFVTLACGLPNRLAHQIAFWAQLPDEVSELDAKQAGYTMARRSVWEAAGDWVYEHTVGAAEDVYAAANNEIADMAGQFGAGLHYIPLRRPYFDLTVNINVQRGLHCLTGEDWDTETEKRRRNSIDATIEGENCFEFGLALHALGDSFAHRNHQTHRMYPTGLGHGPETIASETDLGSGLGLVHADALGPHRREHYRAYVTMLHGVVKARFPQAVGAKMLSADECATALGGIIVPNPVARDQIATIRNMAEHGLHEGMNEYRPELTDEVPFAEFHPRNTPVLVSRLHVDRALQFAALWAGPSGDRR